MPPKAIRLSLTIFYALLAVAGAALSTREYAAARSAYPTSQGVSSGDINTYSTISYGATLTNKSLANCFAKFDTPPLEQTSRTHAATTCLTLANTVLQSAPSHAAALQLRAEALAMLGQPNAAAQAAHLSDLAAPNTAWLMQRRLILLAELPAQNLTPLHPMIARMTRKLLSDPTTRTTLARNSAQTPALRSLLTQATNPRIGAAPNTPAEAFQ